MKHYGDITKINGAEAPVVDIITGGSPCQDLSVAGKRAGLAGERSGLFMEQMRIVKEMRERERATGRTGWMVRPRYMVWENVPGAFSSGNPKGADFAAVIEEIIKVAEPVRRLVNVDSGEERLELAYRKGKVWRSVIIEKSVIASSSQILQLAAFGVMVNSENAKALSTYLFDLEEMNYERLPEQNSVGRLGWVVAKGFSPYVDDLIFDGRENGSCVAAELRRLTLKHSAYGNWRSWQACPGAFTLSKMIENGYDVMYILTGKRTVGSK